MGKLIYAMNVSADGFVADAEGSIEFTEPEPEVHAYFNALVRASSTSLYGRRLYELMEAFWPAARERDDLDEVTADFAEAYAGTPRVVFSDTLERVGAGARLVRSADAVGEVRRLKAESEGLLDLGGPGLAASLAGLIDEFHVLVLPVVVGAGTPYWPAGMTHTELRLVEHRAFPAGTVLLRYERVTSPASPPRP